MRYLVMMTVISLAGLGLLLSAGNADGPAATGVAASPAPEAGAEVDLARLTDRFEGLTFPHRKANLSFGRVSGVVATRPVDIGDTVRAGQLIAKLRSNTEEAALKISRLKATSEHEYLAQKMNEEQSRVEFDRVQNLFKRDLATKWEFEKAEVENRIARLRTEYARFQQSLVKLELDRDQAALDERTLLAPWPGMINEVYAEPGSAVQESMPVVELAQYDPLRIELNIPESSKLTLVPGKKAIVEIGEARAEGRIVVVQPQVDARSRTFRVRVELPNPELKFQAGKTAHVRFFKDAAGD